MSRENTPRILEMNTHPRRAHFEYFSSLAYPYVGVTSEVDISPLNRFRQASGAPFFLTLLYCVSRAANSVPELRQRIRDGQIIEYPFCPSSHTEARKDGTYGYCTLWADKDFAAYLPAARRAQEISRTAVGLQEDEDVLSCFFVSSLPWLSYTSLIQPVPCPADSNPRITWGRAFERDGRSMLPLSLLCHHALVDGLHIARFYQALEKELHSLL